MKENETYSCNVLLLLSFLSNAIGFIILFFCLPNLNLRFQIFMNVRITSVILSPPFSVCEISIRIWIRCHTHTSIGVYFICLLSNAFWFTVLIWPLQPLAGTGLFGSDVLLRRELSNLSTLPVSVSSMREPCLAGHRHLERDQRCPEINKVPLCFIWIAS